MKTVFQYLNTLPWAKPIAIITSFIILIAFLVSCAFQFDVPPNSMEMMKWFGTIVVPAAMAKSGYEHVRSGKKKEVDGGEDDGHQRNC